ncbi:MAG: immunoglobulin domain-containing protein, partial [Verrucomicrobia bacterium]|nr:immunoglobulin domain-containing protein [Verrucomicrobiota bacterium]
MKKLIYLILTLYCSFGASLQAANLVASNLGNGIALPGGSTGLASGTIKFGVFPAGYDFAANIGSYSALDSAFVEVASYSGAITAFNLNGFFDLTLSYPTSGSFEGTPYDSTPGSILNTSSTDLVGEKIYVWILNNSTPASANQYAIFSSDLVWTDADATVTDSYASTDSGTDGLVAHYGSLATGSDIGAAANSHVLAFSTFPVSNVVASRTPTEQTVLTGTSVTFSYTASGTGPFTQEWFKVGNATAMGTGATLTLSSLAVGDAGSYFVKVSNSTSNADSNAIALAVVAPTPVSNVAASRLPSAASVLSGSSVTFSYTATGTEPFTQEWFKVGENSAIGTGTTLTLTNLQMAASGSYYVRVTNQANSDNSNNVALSVVDELPVSNVIASRSPNASAVLNGTSVTFSYAASGTGPFTQEWYKVGSNTALGTATTLVLSSAQVADTGDYYVKVSNIGSNADSNNVALSVVTELPVSNVVATRNPLSIDVVAGTPVTFSYSAAGTGPFTQEWFKAGNATAIGTSSTLTLNSPQLADSGQYSVRVSNMGTNAASNFVSLNVVAPIPAFKVHPSAAAAKVGANVVFSVTATGQGPLSYRWLKGTAAIPGAVTDSLTLYGVGLADSGLYRCEVSNVIAGKPNKVLSNQAQLTIVQDNAPAARVVVRESTTGSTTLTLSYAETGVATANKATLQWKKDGNIIPGATLRTLRITPLAVSASPAIYTCEVTARGVAVPTVGATTELIVVNQPPLITSPLALNMPDGKVGEPYSYQVLVDTTLSRTPATFTALLPLGLVINKFTGEITGRPQALTLAGKPFKVSITVANGVLPNAIATDMIEIAPLAPNLSGKWVGPIQRAPLSQELGGRFDLDLMPTGAASGTITLGTVVHRFAGGLVPDPVNNKHTVTMTVKRLINQPPLTVSFSLSQNLLTDGVITDGVETLSFGGWRNKWLATPTAATAADYVANYHLRLQNDDTLVMGNLDYPQGISFASFSVAKDGKLTFTGKLADGELITGSTFMGPTGQVCLFQLLYKTVQIGSLLGQFTIDSKANADVKDNSLSGGADWSRSANIVANTLYKNGFPAISLDIKGGAYTAPVSPLLVLNIATGTNNAEVKLNGGALNVSGNDVVETASITTGSKITVANVGLLNIKLTAVSTTGALSGTLVSRTSVEKLEGMIVP